MNFVSTVCLRRSDTHGQQTCMFSSSRTGFLGSKFLGERNPPRVDESWLESSERQFQRRRTTWRASALHGRKPAPPRVLHRIFASLMYLIPYLDVLVFGEFVFRKMPMIKTFLVAPFAPILMIYRGIPFVAFAVYLLVYFLVGKNRNYSYFIRYNAHQAILLDIAILIPQLLFILMTNVPPFFLEGISNAVFFLMIGAVGYSISKIAQGRIPTEVPLISGAVQSQIGPVDEDDV
uniref:Tic20 family protein Ycf60 n=2 Tax=Rhodosorus marinus TaxID=101924 RepID=A0A7S2ZU58_9RHOD|mmetsp:Transcript_30868/g.118376  ORF Transcript_30868/g.118376 Transcript_30868/m.118376 type:complete len:234 (-) Transcript_30868:1639-2340(-)